MIDPTTRGYEGGRYSTCWERNEVCNVTFLSISYSLSGSAVFGLDGSEVGSRWTGQGVEGEGGRRSPAWNLGIASGESKPVCCRDQIHRRSGGRGSSPLAQTATRSTCRSWLVSRSQNLPRRIHLIAFLTDSAIIPFSRLPVKSPLTLSRSSICRSS